MDTYDCILTNTDIREFNKKTVPKEIKMKVLESGRVCGSAMNSQHWHFILVEEEDGIKKLFEDSKSGKWILNANFAVILATSGDLIIDGVKLSNNNYKTIDLGRVLQNMKLVAWNFGVVSCIYTVFDLESLRIDFNIPQDVTPSVIIGFGYPVKKIVGKKLRKHIDDIAFSERYGIPINSK